VDEVVLGQSILYVQRQQKRLLAVKWCIGRYPQMLPSSDPNMNSESLLEPDRLGSDDPI
jgi:hypothetical protein